MQRAQIGEIAKLILELASSVKELGLAETEEARKQNCITRY